jgi:tetratricopeptide (TPR) repeat protein
MHSKINYLYFCIASSLLASLGAVDTNQAPLPAQIANPVATQPVANAQPAPITFTIPPSITDNQPEKLEPVTDNILLICLLMVKDEAHIIKETLDPYVKAGFKHFLIYEAGRSKDNTVEVAKQYFKDKGIEHGYIVQGTFGDFSSARNRALDAAHEKFPNAAFLTFGDAEWYLHNGEKLFDFCKEHLNEKDVHSYSIRIMNASIDFDTPRIIRNDGVARFKGRVHEVPLPASAKQAPRDIYFELGGTAIGAEKSRKRWERDAELLMMDHLENPQDARPIFYLGQTYDGLNQLDKAYEFYKKRSEIKSWDQEDYVAVFRLANIVERMVAAGDKNHTWAEALELYLKAYNMRPTRAEPLMRLARHYWEDNVNTPEKRLALAFLFARRAAEIHYPSDLLFIDKGAYDFDRYEMLSKTAWYVGECPTGERATRILLEKYSQSAQLHRNLALYLECTRAETDLWGYNTTCPHQ